MKLALDGVRGGDDLVRGDARTTGGGQRPGECHGECGRTPETDGDRKIPADRDVESCIVGDVKLAGRGRDRTREPNVLGKPPAVDRAPAMHPRIDDHANSRGEGRG